MTGLVQEPRSLELLEAFVALMPDAAIVVDAEGSIILANEHAATLFGHGPKELTGQRIESLVPERYRRAHRQLRANYSKEPESRPMGAGPELLGRRKDGSEFPVDISLAPLAGSDRPLFVAAVRDISERKAIGAAAAQLAAIVQSSVDGIVSTSTDGHVTSWNPAAERLFGYEAAEITGRHLSVLIPEGDAAYAELVAGIVAGHGAPPSDTRWLRRDGTLLDVALSVSPVRDHAGELLGFSALVRDITYRKVAEAELRRLAAEQDQRARMQSATSEIRLSLLSAAPLAESLDVICRRSCELLGGDAAGVITQVGGRLEVVAAAGALDPAKVVGQALDPDLSFTGRTMAGGTPQSLPSLADASDLDIGSFGAVPTGPVIAVPLTFEAAVRGVLMIVRADGAPEFGPDELGVAQSLGDHAALALELARSRLDEERLLLAGDRDRIARDLHDLVIQRLFATGMSLQSVLGLLGDGRAAQKVGTAVDDLDTTIREIRSAIFALETPTAAASGFRSEVLRLSARAAEGLGFEPTVRFDGPVDSALSTPLTHEILAVIREALSNVARHARATRVTVEVCLGPTLVVRVVDDGIGMGEATRSSGLTNLRQRAESLGGTLETRPGPQGGTRLEWEIVRNA